MDIKRVDNIFDNMQNYSCVFRFRNLYRQGRTKTDMTYHHKCSCGAEINYNTDIKQKTEYKCPFCNKKFNFQENDHERIKGSENSGQGK